jgi:hypothetical protein
MSWAIIAWGLSAVMWCFVVWRDRDWLSGAILATVLAALLSVWLNG